MALDYDDDGRDDPQEQDILDSEDGDDCVPCPSCGRDIFEEAEQCPYCGDWVIPRASTGLPWVWLLAAVLALIAMLVISVF